MNTFCAADEHVSDWRRTGFALETNTLKRSVWTSATHTQLQCTCVATSDFQTELMSRWSLVTSTHLQKQALSSCGDPKGTSTCRCTTTSSMALNWPYYWQLPGNRCGLTICATPRIHEQKPQKSMNASVLHIGGQFLGRSSYNAPNQKRKMSGCTVFIWYV